MSALTFMTEKLSCEHLGARNLLKEKNWYHQEFYVFAILAYIGFRNMKSYMFLEKVVVIHLGE